MMIEFLTYGVGTMVETFIKAMVTDMLVVGAVIAAAVFVVCKIKK